MPVDKPCFTEIVGTAKSRKRSSPSIGGHPNVAFTILEEVVDGVAGKAVRPRKQIRSSLVHMQESPVVRSDPQTAIAIAEQPIGAELPPEARKRIRLELSRPRTVSIPPSPEIRSPPLSPFDQGADFGRRFWHRIEFRRPRLPSPQPVCRSRPEIAFAVLVQGEDSAGRDCRPFRSTGRCRSESRRVSPWE